MMHSDVVSFITSLLEKKQRLPKCNDIGAYRYLEAGHIDSLAVMRFVINLEDHFNIEISEDDMLSEHFQTVDGLADIILSKV